MIISAKGSGKESIADHISAGILGINQDKIYNYPFFTKISPEKNTVSIEKIRELQKFLQLRTTGTAELRRIAVIIDAHLMTVEAQNALLKVLEEPPSDTAIILTTVGEKSLKSTIYSRVRQLQVKIPSQQSAIEYFSANGYDKTNISKNYLLSGGSIGLLSSLLKDASSHGLVEALNTAKQLLGSDTYTRLTRADEISKKKESIPDLLFALKRISTAALHNAAKSNNEKLVSRWHKTLDAVHKAEASLKNSPNSKLLLTHLFLQM